MKKYKVGIVGGSGYGGSELLRLLMNHPQMEIAFVTAHQHAGKRIDEVHPNLRGWTDQTFLPSEVSEAWNQVDGLFLAVPHGRSMHLMEGIEPHVKVVDLTGDFRLRDQQVFEAAYKRDHVCFDLQAQFVYGLTEINKEAIAGATRVANPGCFATATLMGLFPLIAKGVIEGKVVIDAKTGSSGSGASPKAGTHHPKRSNSLYAYKLFTHQHLPEVDQALQQVNPGWSGRLVFQTHSAPMVRGILASIYCTMKTPMTHAEIGEVYAAHYGDAPFVRLLEGAPDVNWVKATNFTDIGWGVRGEDLNLFVAIDNLVKGASGQAIQNMNLMFGLEESMGLRVYGTNP